MLIVRHTDETREFAYDRKSSIGRLDKALDEANANGWTVVDMSADWKKVFAFEATPTATPTPTQTPTPRKPAIPAP